MASKAPTPSFGGGSWSMGKQAGGTIFDIQDLGEQYGLNLARDKTIKNKAGHHVAFEYGFGSMYLSIDAKYNIVDPPNGERGGTVKFTSGAYKFTATVFQIAINRTGAFARIVVAKNSVKTG